ncbi:RTA1 like protein-domain-containing protein [Fusarium venenatum]|uniref:RTA1 like protein-domain-containing protein n=1 Tax=Fusarium venenatum TaxID=56646 RepID=UPI001D71E03A|nr:RTA1 like protein-domain-containing protein [Fusarium venenatum]
MANYFHYDPSFLVAILFFIIFTVSLNVHVYQVVTTRVWFFLPFLAGCVFESMAFICRAVSAKEAPDYTVGVCMVQDHLLLLGPTCYSATIYTLLGRFIKYLEGDKYALIKPRWLTKIFLFGDITSITLQAFGMNLVQCDRLLTTTEGAVVAGLIVQLVFFTMFVVVTVCFHYRFAKNSLVQPPNWDKFMMAIYFACILILVRSIYRMVEYVQGPNAELQSTEVYVYALDAIPMAIVTTIFHVIHPSSYMPVLDKTLSKTESEVSLTYGRQQ